MRTRVCALCRVVEVRRTARIQRKAQWLQVRPEAKMDSVFGKRFSLAWTLGLMPLEPATTNKDTADPSLRNP